MKKLIIPPLYVVLFSFLLFSCSNDDDEVVEDDLPVFGTCEPVNPKGNLSISGNKNGIFTYKTNGGGKIVIDTEKNHTFKFTHADYPDFSIEFWGEVPIDDQIFMGGAHENLNGKHVKDFEGKYRTFIFPDGTKFTLALQDPRGRTMYATIYEGTQCHHINFYCNTLEYSEANSLFTQRLDAKEFDGETATFEFTKTGLMYLNIYTEDTPGKKIEKRINIGEIFRDQPHVVNDYYP